MTGGVWPAEPKIFAWQKHLPTATLDGLGSGYSSVIWIASSHIIPESYVVSETTYRLKNNNNKHFLNLQQSKKFSAWHSSCMWWKRLLPSFPESPWDIGPHGTHGRIYLCWVCQKSLVLFRVALEPFLLTTLQAMNGHPEKCRDALPAWSEEFTCFLRELIIKHHFFPPFSRPHWWLQ